MRFLPDPKAFEFFVGIVLLLVAIKLIREAWNKGTDGQQNSCSLEDQLDNVSKKFMSPYTTANRIINLHDDQDRFQT